MQGGRQRERFVYRSSSFRSDMFVNRSSSFRSDMFVYRSSSFRSDMLKQLDFQSFSFKFGLVFCKVTCMEVDNYRSMIFC